MYFSDTGLGGRSNIIEKAVMASGQRSRKRKLKPVRASDLASEDVSWDEVFKYAKGIPKRIQIE